MGNFSSSISLLSSLNSKFYIFSLIFFFSVKVLSFSMIYGILRFNSGLYFNPSYPSSVYSLEESLLSAKIRSG